MPMKNYPQNIPPFDTAKVKRRINYMRTKRDMSLYDLSRATGINVSTLSNIELKCSPAVALVHVVSIAKALDVDPMWLFGLTGGTPDDAVEIDIAGQTVLLEKEIYQKLLENEQKNGENGK